MEVNPDNQTMHVRRITLDDGQTNEEFVEKYRDLIQRIAAKIPGRILVHAIH
jgi:hypothetical protein